jgi:hypothetical protein
MHSLLLPLLLLGADAAIANEWRAVPDAREQVALFRDGKQLGNYSFAGRYYRPYFAKTDSWGDKTKPPIAPPDKPIAAPSAPPGPSALDEVNARRAQRGLPPFQEDAGLTAAAQGASEFRAARLIEGHTANDFQFLPPGAFATAAGCAAWPPEMGWGSCCSEEMHRYAGAGWAMGRDGRRYMHLFVR